MGVEEFRDRVTRAFGEDLHRASPATVREFLDELQMDAASSSGPLLGSGSTSPFEEAHSGAGRRIEINESAKSYEEVMRTFFARVLELPEGDAVRLLWTVAFDLSYAIIESHDAERIGHLFRGMEP